MYQKYRNNMKTGDVIAFSGKGRVSQIIKWKTRSQFSHVGIILDTNMHGGIGHAVMLIESTSLKNIPDAVHNEIIKGVQIHFLSRRLETYEGKAWWVPLKNELSNFEKNKMQAWLRKKHFDRTPYDFFQAIGAGADLFDMIIGIENEPDFSSLFCSELVTKSLQVAGIVPDELNPSEQTPEDVVKFCCFKDAVPLF
ncbi:MAG: hypothetical protein COV35_03665 [Alphaproteobacteria bacterium CG11_big_fil_rev_8_21_14_0_20_39_49]|nr:MAG: hypothetical protein COV35_03665 [Alphaproteobacteria bacterium CG11_big_fil_rev_8_21_14_0_20_39_49]